ncbi:pyridoxamine 5'-phosphate oxidase family protein [Gordonia jinhuaensis]|uniref:Flavin-nucleotide-binding protein n=1 Tax=Gordonia jinhuaensis TaxID=1517702 RepID=A0A916WVI5_9ACTN|nr:pyridoxamine 5'-phosphate oxidase family protein [Gordonia jinhuaensis]GGB35944.1 flavin-nucleotide-binding protein [Gordonia jinhuaensis]
MTALDELNRYRSRGADRDVLDALLDEVKVGVLSTVVDGLPWSVPMLFARVGDRILLHGSTGAGALRQVATGAPATFTVFALDGLVVAETLFDHSANYRSAVIRGCLEMVEADEADVLRSLSDKLIPGRASEVPTITGKETAATLTLSMAIGDDNWLCKARSGGPAEGSGDTWTGVIPVSLQFGDPVTATGDEPPASVRSLRR